MTTSKKALLSMAVTSAMLANWQISTPREKREPVKQLSTISGVAHAKRKTRNKIAKDSRKRNRGR